MQAALREKESYHETFLSIGTGPGIGFPTAERFAKEGFQIALAARGAAKTHQLADKLRWKGHTAEAGTVDSGDPESVAKLVAEVEKQYGSIDVLHCRSGRHRSLAVTILRSTTDFHRSMIAMFSWRQ
jgi:NAD(P)-dependent dehydrogenase (short-subunit alcohol dehydrogenase family)